MIMLVHIKENWKDHLVQIISLLFIILFTYAAVSKLTAFETFRLQLEQSPYIGPFADVLVWSIPAVEIFISFLFFSKGTRLLALISSFSLMLFFTVYIIGVLNFADSIPCSCGGVIASLSWNEHLIFNIGFIGLAVLGLTIEKHHQKHSNLENLK